jgi:sporulation protein YqfC
MASLRERLARALEIPEEAVADVPVVSLTGAGRLMIYNHKGILAYSPGEAVIRVANGAVKVMGKNIILRKITAERVTLSGVISGVFFVR